MALHVYYSLCKQKYGNERKTPRYRIMFTVVHFVETEVKKAFEDFKRSNHSARCKVQLRDCIFENLVKTYFNTPNKSDINE